MKWGAIGLGAALVLSVGALVFALSTHTNGPNAPVIVTTFTPVGTTTTTPTVVTTVLSPTVAAPARAAPKRAVAKRPARPATKRSCQGDPTGSDNPSCNSNDNQAGDRKLGDNSGDDQAGDQSSGDNSGDNQAGDGKSGGA